MYYLNYFFLYSLVGHLLESTFCLITNKNCHSGYLFGPWTPVYGIGIIIILLIWKFLNKKENIKNILKIIVQFFLSAILLSVIEFIGGILIEKIFNYTFWNYSNMKFHIGKYVSLEISLIWGLLSVVFALLLKKVSDYIVKKIPKYITHSLIVVFIMDNIFTIMKYLK